MIYIKTPEEIEKLRKGGVILARILNLVIKKVAPGISTAELNHYAEKLINEQGAEPSFKNYQGFPAVLCASINDQVVHAIPRTDSRLSEGDIISLDLGIWFDGLCTDMSRTVPVGRISSAARKLIEVTNKSLQKGIAQVRPGNRVGDISSAVQKYVEPLGYQVVKTLFGHGVGRSVHEDPRIPNYGKPGTGDKLKAGMVLAIEPMVTIGSSRVVTGEDGWSIATEDGSLSAHFEDTVVVTGDGNEVITKIQ